MLLLAVHANHLIKMSSSQKQKNSKSVQKTGSSPVKAQSYDNNNNQNHLAHIQQASFSGPIPPPSILEGYERLVPGAADRILKMAESESRHQQEIEFAALNGDIREGKRGQIFGFSSVIIAFGTAILALKMGSPALAIAIGSTTVVGVVSAFIIGRIVKSK